MKKLIYSLVVSAMALMMASCDDSAFVSSVTLSSLELNLKVGETEQLSVLVIGARSKEPELQWYSHDDSVATVSPKGLVTAVGAGETEVIVQVMDGTGGKSVCVVTVE